MSVIPRFILVIRNHLVDVGDKGRIGAVPTFRIEYPADGKPCQNENEQQRK